MNTNEKDSAFTSYKIHEAKTSFIQLDKDVITKYNDSSCALAGQTGGAIRLSLIFLLFLLCIKTKKRKYLKNILYCFEERKNTTDNECLSRR